LKIGSAAVLGNSQGVGMKSAGKFPVWHIPGVYFRLKERYSYRVLYVWFVWVEWGAAYPVAAGPVHLDLLVP
jgi:hypothetical protein